MVPKGIQPLFQPDLLHDRRNLHSVLLRSYSWGKTVSLSWCFLASGTRTSACLSGLLKGFPYLSIPIQTNEVLVKNKRHTTPTSLYFHKDEHTLSAKALETLFNWNVNNWIENKLFRLTNCQLTYISRNLICHSTLFVSYCVRTIEEWGNVKGKSLWLALKKLSKFLIKVFFG